MPVKRPVVGVVTALAVAAVVVFLAWGLHRAFAPQRLPLQGQIEAQEIHVSSKVPGRVGRVRVALGQNVQAGDVLFELDSPEVQAKAVQAQAAASAARAVAAKADAGARPEEVEMARLNWERARTGAAIAKTTFERVGAMADQGVLAVQKRDEAQAQWRAAEQLAAAAQAQYELARRGARTEDRAAARAQVEQVAGAVSEVEAAIAETRIRAPAAGEVAKVQIQPGELAPQGFPVITLVDLQHPWAVLQVREDAMARFAKGTRHTARVPALDRDIELAVTVVGVLPDFATWRAARPGGTDLRTFEVRLTPVQPVRELRPGMSVVFPAP